MNANISYAQAETFYCLSTLLTLQPKTAGEAAASQEDASFQNTKAILQQIPEVMNLEAISER